MIPDTYVIGISLHDC